MNKRIQNTWIGIIFLLCLTFRIHADTGDKVDRQEQISQLEYQVELNLDRVEYIGPVSREKYDGKRAQWLRAGVLFGVGAGVGMASLILKGHFNLNTHPALTYFPAFLITYFPIVPGAVMAGMYLPGDIGEQFKRINALRSIPRFVKEYRALTGKELPGGQNGELALAMRENPTVNNALNRGQFPSRIGACSRVFGAIVLPKSTGEYLLDMTAGAAGLAAGTVLLKNLPKR